VIDLAHPFYEDHLKVVEDTLKEFGSESKTVFKVFNKVDAVSDRNRIEYVKNYYKDSVIISASKGINVPALRKKLKNMVENSFTEEKVNLNINQSKIASQIYQLAEVLSTKYDEDVMTISYRANKQNSDKIKKIIYGS
jgi:GTP-binding protein HflX